MQNVSSLLVATPSSAVVLKDTVTTVSLTTLVVERKQWESSAYRSSNQQLYTLLAKCYGYYVAMCEGTDAGKSMRKQLNDFIDANGIRITTGTHAITRILKCVFFDGTSTADRRRISTYSIVLRAALSEKISANNVADFIEFNGGVQEVRLAKAPNSKTAKQKAALGQTALGVGPVLARLHKDELSQHFDVNDYDKHVALLAVVRASGDLEVKGVVRAKGALTAALAAHYSAANNTTVRKAA